MLILSSGLNNSRILAMESSGLNSMLNPYVRKQMKFPAIYDFSVYPYALGDVLTWNVQTAIHAKKAGCSSVDILILIDQEDLIHSPERHNQQHKLLRLFC